MEKFDETTVKGRLIKFLKEKRVSQSQLARELGVSVTYVGAMRKSLPEDRVKRLCELYPDLNREWLLHGEGEMLINSDRSGNNPEYRVPLLPVSAFAGSLQNWSDGVEISRCETITSPIKGVDLAIRISGDSMEPTFRDGSILYINKINEKAFIPWGQPMVIDTENGVLVKAVYPVDNDNEYIEARSHNSHYPPIMIPTSSIYGLYRVMGSATIFSTM